MSDYIIYTSDGAIARTGRCPEGMLDIQAQAGEAVMEGVANDATQYIVAGVVTNKPPMGSSIDKTSVLANGADVATISGLPNPTIAKVSGLAGYSVTVIDGSLQLTFDTTGTYYVSLSSVNKLPQEYTINAT